MMLIFLLFIVALPTVATEKPCCGPSQWEGKLSSSRGIHLPNGVSQGKFASYNYSFDYDAKLIAMKGVIYGSDQRKINVHIIEDYTSNVLYYVDLDQHDCTKEDLELPFLRCVPDTATYINSYMYGYADKQIPGHMWFVKGQNVDTYIAVSGDGRCIPFTQTLFISSPVPVIISTTTTDFTPGIKDRSVFVIPDICNKA